MRSFSISEVEGFCEVKAATLRIWEKRYGLCVPVRKDGGHRQYNLLELELLLHTALLNRNGHKISKLATLNSKTLLEKASALTHIEDRFQHAVNLLIIYKFSTDVDAFEKHLDNCFPLFGVDDTFRYIVIPFLEKANILSYASTANEVHLAVTLIRKKIIYYIETLTVNKKTGKTALLFLPEEEHYDLMLLYMCYVVKAAGLKPIYLGTNIAEENIMIMLKQKKPDYLCTYLTPKSRFKMFDVLSYLFKTSPDKKLHVVCNGKPLNHVDNPNIHYTHYNHFADLLKDDHE